MILYGFKWEKPHGWFKTFIASFDKLNEWWTEKTLQNPY